MPFDPAHHMDDASLEMNDLGFYTARCVCGWTMGPLPDVETVADALMEHAATVSQGDSDG